jgi:transposase-like protein
MARRSRYSPEVRQRAVRMVFESKRDYGSQWAAILSIAQKIGCTPETLRTWVQRVEVDTGTRNGVTSDESARIKQLEREVFELRHANEILRKASAFPPKRSSTADRSDDGVRRRTTNRRHVKPTRRGFRNACNVMRFSATRSGASGTRTGASTAHGRSGASCSEKASL